MNLLRKPLQIWLLGIVLVLAATGAKAQFTFTTNADGITITITGDTNIPGNGAVTIPTNINGLTVVSIGNYAFYDDSSLTSLVVPDAVTNIGNSAFYECYKLNKMQFPSSVGSIGNEAFFDCDLTNVNIPYGVTSIGYFAFGYCIRLTNATISSSVTNIGSAPFNRCSALTGISVNASNPAYCNLGNVLFDKNQTALIQFPAGQLGSYAVSNTVTTIGTNAFAGCKLTNIAIPSSVTNICEDAFFICSSLTAINVDSNNPAYSSVAGVLFNEDQTTLIQYPGGLTGSYAIPNTVAYIGLEAFFECYGLTSVVIPNSVTNIEDEAFFDCSSLTTVSLGSGLTSIGLDAFDLCTSLTSITIPNSVTNIGSGAFAGCSGLTKVYFEGNPPNAFDSFLSDNNATAYYLPGTSGWAGFTTYSGLSAVLWNPQPQTSDASFGVQNGQFGFNITGTPNIPILVEACTNLASPTWAPLTNVNLTNGLYYFSDSQWSKYPGRFYRISAP